MSKQTTMTTPEYNKVKNDAEIFAEAGAQRHVAFTSDSFPKWAKGHESELAEIFTHYAKIGASEAMDYLRRNSMI